VGLRASAAADKGIDLPLEEVQRHAAGAEHDVVELPDRETVAERGARLLAQLDNLPLSGQAG
jgi:hypothetical protein